MILETGRGRKGGGWNCFLGSLICQQYYQKIAFLYFFVIIDAIECLVVFNYEKQYSLFTWFRF